MEIALQSIKVKQAPIEISDCRLDIALFRNRQSYDWALTLRRYTRTARLFVAIATQKWDECAIADVIGIKNGKSGVPVQNQHRVLN